MTSDRWRPAVALAATLLATTLTASCSGGGDCHGQAYHPDLGQAGAKTPIRALEVWLGTPVGFTASPPPDDGWIAQATDGDTNDKDLKVVAITNDAGDGWWVTARKTDSGGWVIDQATDDAGSCSGELSGG